MGGTPKHITNKERKQHRQVQATLEMYMVLPKSTTDRFTEVWGHYPDKINTQKTLRILFNNP
jgi:hypothetical protein